MNKKNLNYLVDLSQKPLKDEWLESFHPSHEPVPYWRFLYHYVELYRPKVCIEIGTWEGVGSAHLCAAAASYGGIVIGLDILSHPMTATRIQERYGNYFFIEGDSVDSAPVVMHTLAMDGLNLVFQDSSHHYYASHREWNHYSQMLTGDWIWICDDITESFHDPKVDPPGKSMVNYFHEIEYSKPIKKYLYPDKLHKGNTVGIIIPVSYPEGHS